MKEVKEPERQYCQRVDVLCKEIESCFDVKDGKLDCDKARLCRIIDRNLWLEKE